VLAPVFGKPIQPTPLPLKTVVVNGFIWRLADNENPIKQNPPRPYGFWRIYADFQMVGGGNRIHI